MAFYDKLQKTATDAINKYGTHVQLINSSRVILSVVKGVMGTIKAENVPASIVERSTGVLSVTVGPIKPDTTHYVNFLGETYKIIHVEEINPAGTPLLYQLYVSK